MVTTGNRLLFVVNYSLKDSVTWLLQRSRNLEMKCDNEQV